MKKTYRIAKNGPRVSETGRALGPGCEIELEEERALCLAGTLELDGDGKPVIVREEKAAPVEEAKPDPVVAEKAVENPPADKMVRKRKTTRKGK